MRYRHYAVSSRFTCSAENGLPVPVVYPCSASLTEMPRRDSFSFRFPCARPLAAFTSSGCAEQTDTKERIGISIRMDGDTHDELRRISYETRTSIQKLVMQGIKGVISKHPAK